MTSYGLTVGMIGPTAAAVKRDLLKRGRSAEWNRLVRNAHRRGYAIDSFLDPNIPQPLKQRTPQYLRQQATQMVGTAYAPAVKELDAREQRIKALDEKRANDNQFFLNWLNAQHQALTAAATAADSALQTTAQGIQKATGDAYDQAKQGAIQQLSQLPGTVSDFQGANALTGIDAHKATAVGQVGATGAQSLAEIGTAQGMRELASANNFATIAAQEAKRVGDTWGALQDLGSDRLKLKSSEAQDLSKAIQDALTQEITKAQSNRDYAAVSQKLGLQAAEDASQAAARRANTRHQAASLRETIAYHRQLVDAKKDAEANKDVDFMAKWGVSRETFASWTDKQRQDYLARARARGVIPGGGSKAFTDTQIRAGKKTYRGALNWARSGNPRPGELNSLVEALTTPKGEGQTVHDPQTGKIIYNKDGTPKKLGGGGYGLDDPLLARAVAEVAIYGGVNEKLAKKIMAAYWITLPRSKQVSFKPKAGAPTLIDKAG